MVTWATEYNQITTATSSYKYVDPSTDTFTDNRAITSESGSTGTVSFEADGFYNGDSSAYPAVFGLDDGTTTNAQVNFGFGGIGSANQISLIEGATTLSSVAASIGDLFKIQLNYSTGDAKYYKNGTLLTTTTGHTFPTTVYGFTTAYYVGDGIKDITMSTGSTGQTLLAPPPAFVRF